MKKLYILIALLLTMSFSPAYGISAGPDVSSYQGVVDWQKVANSKITKNNVKYPVKFAFAKATEGTWVDPTFTKNWRRIKRVGLSRGAYDFGDFSRSGRAEATTFVNKIKSSGGVRSTDVLILDAEGSTGRNQASVARYTQNWLNTVQRLTGLPKTQLGVYTGTWWSDQHFSKKATRSFGRQGYKLWISQYDNLPVKSLAGWPATWQQFTDHAKIPGIGYGDASIRLR